MPVEDQRERCPTCGSDNRRVRKTMYHPTEDADCFDPWHSPAVPESAPICGNYAEYVGDGIGCDKDKGHEGNCGKKVSGAEPSRRER